jgi:uncharacterized protein (TIGR02266 family)
MTGKYSLGRRWGPRAQFDIKVGVESAHRMFVGLVDNISTGGLFIATEQELKVGDKIEVKFTIPGSEHNFDKKAEVMWVRPYADVDTDRNAAVGAGVRLLELTDDEKLLLNGFIDQRDPMFFID